MLHNHEQASEVNTLWYMPKLGISPIKLFPQGCRPAICWYFNTQQQQKCGPSRAISCAQHAHANAHLDGHALPVLKPGMADVMAGSRPAGWLLACASHIWWVTLLTVRVLCAGHRSTRRESLSLKKGMLHYIYSRKLMTQVLLNARTLLCTLPSLSCAQRDSQGCLV